MLTGYTDRLSARPGQRLSFMVSAPSGRYDVQFYRIFNGDTDESGPGEKLLPIKLPANGVYAGKEQRLRHGSYIEIAPSRELALDQDFTIFLWVQPTLVGQRERVLLCSENASGQGYRLCLNAVGVVFFQSGQNKAILEGPLELARWQWVAVRYEVERKRITLQVGRLRNEIALQPLRTLATSFEFESIGAEVPLFMGADGLGGFARDGFDGRLASPTLYSRFLGDDELLALSMVEDHADFCKIEGCVAAWDFNVDHGSVTIHDTSPNALHGKTVQNPIRMLTGPHWRGDIDDARFDKHGYSAIDFHSDSLSDAKWEESFSLEIPENLPSGIYIARISDADEYDDLPFIVSPALGTRQSDVALLVPTFTYLAYGNYPDQTIPGIKCVYNKYADGTGVPFASALHPIRTIRPHRGFVISIEGKPFARHLSADLYFLDWINEIGQSVDLITDHDLHFHGLDVIKGYKGVFTGSHPEYVSGQILDALEEYLSIGGSLAYMGGNGFYSVTSLSADGSYIEVRRPNGSRPWSSLPGEGHHSLTGEIGGLWRFRGRAPQKLVGVGFTSQGYNPSDECGPPLPHVQVAERENPLARELLDGVGEDEKIGDFKTVGLGVGTAGDEIDRTDALLGTPFHTVVLAQAAGFCELYQPVIEDLRESCELAVRPPYPGVRSDMIAFETPAGGFVFSVGTMQWFSALSFNDYKNNVSQITRNVLEKMLSQCKC